MKKVKHLSDRAFWDRLRLLQQLHRQRKNTHTYSGVRAYSLYQDYEKHEFNKMLVSVRKGENVEI